MGGLDLWSKIRKNISVSILVNSILKNRMPIKVITKEHILNNFYGMDRRCLILLASTATNPKDFELLSSLVGVSCYALFFDQNQKQGRETITALQHSAFRIERDWALYLLNDGGMIKFPGRPRNEQETYALAKEIKSKFVPERQMGGGQGPIYPMPSQQPQQNNGLLQPNRALGNQINISATNSKMAGDESVIPHNQSWKSMLAE